MNEHDLSAGLRTIHRERAVLPGAPSIHQRVRGIQFDDIPQQSRWLPQSPKWRFQSMFSATKFVVAGVIVALFGGFLLAGVLTQPSDDRLPVIGASASATTQAEPTDVSTSEPEPTADEPADTATTPDLIPGVDLVTEEIEPGFLRVLSDGVRDLTQERSARIVYGQDGSFWLFRDKEFFRLGDPVTHEWPNVKKQDADDPRNADDIEVGPDGVVWWADVGGKGLWSFDGEAWTLRRATPIGEDGMLDEVEVLPDGTVLASWRSNGVRKVARLDADGWEVFKTIDTYDGRLGGKAILDTNDTGDAWLALHSNRRAVNALYRGHYEEGSEIALRRVKLPPENVYAVRLVDGTVWADPNLRDEVLDMGQADDLPDLADALRLDGDTWTVHPDGHPQSPWPIQSTEDGHLWYTSSCEWRNPVRAEAYLHGCELVHFDGQDVSRFRLGDAYEWKTVVAPGGTLWLVLDGVEGGGLYVIALEAVAGSEPEIDDSPDEDALMAP